MKVHFSKVRRLSYGAIATLVLATSMVPVFTGSASAAGQVSSRSVQMSNATPSATTSYLVQFTPFTTAAQSLVIDFCVNSPIISGSCTAPTGFSASSVGFTAGTGTTSWTLGTTAASTVKVTKGAGANLGTSAVNFTLTSIVNPSTTGTFYARIYTYGDATYGGTGTAYSTPTAIGTNVDYGGFAMSTVTAISVSATVQEQLTFCVSAAAPGTGCSGLTAPTVTLGTGSPVVLTAAAATGQTGTVYHQITTNAVGSAVVRLKNTSSTTCTGLSRDGGTTCAIAGHTGFSAITTGAGEFGLNVSNGSGGTGTVTASASYGTTAGQYGMGANTITTYGDTISTTTGAVTDVNTTMQYAASAAASTPAGVYTATHSLIATGTF